MEVNTLANFKIISKRAKVFIHGRTGESTMANGGNQRCTVKGNTHGLMVENMMVSIKMT